MFLSVLPYSSHLCGFISVQQCALVHLVTSVISRQISTILIQYLVWRLPTETGEDRRCRIH